MRGVAFVAAVTVVAEVGDFIRFDNPRQVMAYLGLPFLALASVLLLLGALLVFTTLIHLIGLSDPKSALGLPEGSVRALLALALLGLFAIMASSVLTTGQTNPPTQVDEFGKQMLTLVGTLMTAVISFYFDSTPSSANMPPPPGLASSAPQRVNDYRTSGSTMTPLALAAAA